MSCRIASIVLALTLSSALSVVSSGPTTQWSVADPNGAAVVIPAPHRTSLIIFARSEQEQSREAIRLIGTMATDAQVFVVLSGPRAIEEGKTLAKTIVPQWTVAVDKDYELAGQMDVHAWPTTVLIGKDGATLAHLAGEGPSFVADLSAHLDFSAGRIDAVTLKVKLGRHAVVGDDEQQKARRHMQVGRQMMESGNIEGAEVELVAAATLRPKDAEVLLTLVRLRLMQERAQEALNFLDQLPADAVPAWQTNLLRGKAMVELRRWDEAKLLLSDAMRLNPDPAEAHYLLGMVYRQAKEWEKAAEEFRQAWESKSEFRNKSH